MIQPNDLRIGNLVECSGKVTKINSIHTIFAFSTMGHAVDLLYNNDAYVESARVEDINPIPITHDWIRKLGFNINLRGWSKSGFMLFYHNRNIVFGIQAQVVSYRSIEYIHQLQNLYFAIIGEELTIK